MSGSDFDFSEPLDVEVPEGPVDVESAAELSKLMVGYKTRALEEEHRRANAVSTDFYFAAVFRTQADRDKFLAAVGVTVDNGILDGYDLASKLGVDLAKPPRQERGTRGTLKGLRDLPRIGGDGT